jgi:hypothetical protein
MLILGCHSLAGENGPRPIAILDFAKLVGDWTASSQARRAFERSDANPNRTFKTLLMLMQAQHDRSVRLIFISAPRLLPPECAPVTAPAEIAAADVAGGYALQKSFSFSFAEAMQALFLFASRKRAVVGAKTQTLQVAAVPHCLSESQNPYWRVSFRS